MDNYGLLSLLPPVVAILLAVATRRVILSLLTGVLAGAVLLGGGDLGKTGALFFETYLWTCLTEEGHQRIFAFTLLMGAMVGVLGKNGGMQGVVRLLSPMARGRRGTQLTTWLLGLVIFFDDYANTLLLGSAMRPMADRFRVSREKLAYIVDSTAAPVAGLALISTWVAAEIQYIQEGLNELTFSDGTTSGMDLFVASIPYRFYVWAALVFVVLIAIMKRDFGPMLAAERRAEEKGSGVFCRNGPKDALHKRIPTPFPSGSDRAARAIVPILTMLAVTIGLLFSTGYNSELSQSWAEVFCAGDPYIALLYASLVGLLLAAIMSWGESLSLEEVGEAAFNGARRMLPALAILWMAWTLSSMTKENALGTGEYLGGIISNTIAPMWLPSVIFFLASAIAFSTGTSWGTMGILMPLAMKAAHAVLLAENGSVATNDPIFLGVIGSVLAGAIFGDHCSPISDTTVLSSQASGCDHVAHVVTQMPYAVSAAVVAVVCGTLPVAMGASVWLFLPLGLVGSIAIVYLLGRRVERA